jgi:hypothetical protein
MAQLSREIRRAKQDEVRRSSYRKWQTSGCVRCDSKPATSNGGENAEPTRPWSNAS